MRRQIDPARDAALTRSFAALIRRAVTREDRRERRRKKYRMAIVGWVQMDTSFLRPDRRVGGR